MIKTITIDPFEFIVRVLTPGMAVLLGLVVASDREGTVVVVGAGVILHRQ